MPREVHIELGPQTVSELLVEQSQIGVRLIEELNTISGRELPMSDVVRVLASSVVLLQGQVTNLSLVCSQQQRDLDALQARTRGLD